MSYLFSRNGGYILPCFIMKRLTKLVVHNIQLRLLVRVFTCTYTYLIQNSCSLGYISFVRYGDIAMGSPKSLVILLPSCFSSFALPHSPIHCFMDLDRLHWCSIHLLVKDLCAIEDESSTQISLCAGGQRCSCMLRTCAG